ncbi:hypothetical protein FB192DRAFT_1133557 [Mucor lusitanicus]|uniref:Uncharacterized protein n=1 Tax=Mucor circinelloides f. lusitanicus TaxID=29924 RepID=A0A8H4BC97_MUCCL|nr:hypothetical protein FB192DRAFT_1133557 [Mucor lusitanicus]
MVPSDRILFTWVTSCCTGVAISIGATAAGCCGNGRADSIVDSSNTTSAVDNADNFIICRMIEKKERERGKKTPWSKR